jgi:hypothetical protein
MRSWTSSGNGASFTSATGRIQRIRRLRATDFLDGVRAAVLLTGAKFALRRWGLAPLQRRVLERHPPPATTPVERDEALERARRLAWVVRALVRRGPWKPNCLEKSLVMWWLLRSREIPADLRIGARRARDAEAGGGLATGAEMEFHAWVEYERMVLSDVPYVRRLFATFERPVVPPGARWR